MVRKGILSLVLAAAAACTSMAAQAPVPSAEPLKQRDIRSAEPLKERAVRPLPELGVHDPFSIDGRNGARIVEVRSETAISEQDKLLEANLESTIRERAAFQALDLSSGQWSYSQLACKSFPGHLFLRFNRNNGAGDESAFTVSIPRYGNGRIRFVPLLRRGYSLWSPTPVNAITISAFNHILLEERSGSETESKPDWSSMAVCYAALAGSGGPDADSVELTRAPILHIAFSGEAHVEFITGSRRLSEWQMFFDRKGILKKATRRGIGSEEARNIQPVALGGGRTIPAPENASGKTIQTTVLENPRVLPPALPK